MPVVLREPGGALLLRPWTDHDIPALIAAHDDPAMRRWSTTPITDEHGARTWLDTQHQGWHDGDRLSFAVLDPDNLVAMIVLKDVNTRAEAGYWTAPWARGRGIAARALTTLTIWAFDTFDTLDRIQLLHQIDNHASCRVAHKSGYVLEGTLPAQPPQFPAEGHLHAHHRAP